MIGREFIYLKDTHDKFTYDDIDFLISDKFVMSVSLSENGEYLRIDVDGLARCCNDIRASLDKRGHSCSRISASRMPNMLWVEVGNEKIMGEDSTEYPQYKDIQRVRKNRGEDSHGDIIGLEELDTNVQDVGSEQE